MPADRIAAPSSPTCRSAAPLAFVQEAASWEPQSEPVIARDDAPRILVVDDNADMRQYLKRLLAPRWQVELAADGVEGLDAIRRVRPDVVPHSAHVNWTVTFATNQSV